MEVELLEGLVNLVDMLVDEMSYHMLLGGVWDSYKVYDQLQAVKAMMAKVREGRDEGEN